MGRYLTAFGAPRQLRRAIWAYNHADWYVALVLAQARAYGYDAPATRDMSAARAPQGAAP
jgi:hypothetical protein